MLWFGFSPTGPVSRLRAVLLLKKTILLVKLIIWVSEIARWIQQGLHIQHNA